MHQKKPIWKEKPPESVAPVPETPLEKKPEKAPEPKPEEQKKEITPEKPKAEVEEKYIPKEEAINTLPENSDIDIPKEEPKDTKIEKEKDLAKILPEISKIGNMKFFESNGNGESETSKNPFKLALDFAIKYPYATAEYSFAFIWFILAAMSCIKDISIVFYYKKKKENNRKRIAREIFKNSQ